MRRKKAAIAVVLLLAVVLAAALLIMGPRTAGTDSADITDPSEVDTADKQQSDPQSSEIDDNEELFNQSQLPILFTKMGRWWPTIGRIRSQNPYH